MRLRRINSSTEKVITSNGIYFVNCRSNGYTTNGIQKFDVTVIRVNNNYEPRGNWILSTTEFGRNNYENAQNVVRYIEDLQDRL